MNVKYFYSLLAVLLLALLAYLGTVAHMQVFFGVILPYAAMLIFVIGFVRRVMGWARVPVPFRIPTTAGQQKSMPWVKHSYLDNPTTTTGVVLRMILEVVCFRSLFRNTRMKMNDGKISYKLEIFLWLGAIAFHYAFLTVLVRHFRFFLDPVPSCLGILESVDSFFQVGLPVVFMSGVVLLAAALYLLSRRIFIRQVNYVSLMADYFPLLLIIGIALTGILMRYFTKTDIVGVKKLTMGLVTFAPTIPEGVGAIFYIHLLFVCVLLAYFPFSKLMHLGGIFLSPTRNLPTDTRARRHINPWNYPVNVHTYEEYEDDFREKMIDAGLPVDKMPEETASEEKE